MDQFGGLFAHHMDAQQPHVRAAEDQLQEAGLVTRKPDPKDRRAYIPELTAKAKPVLERVYGLAESVYEEAQAGLTGADVSRLLGQLQAIKANLLAVTAEAPAAAPVRSKHRA